jgi:hypothetical protein
MWGEHRISFLQVSLSATSVRIIIEIKETKMSPDIFRNGFIALKFGHD